MIDLIRKQQILAIGSILAVVTTQFVMGQDGDTLKNLVRRLIYGACKDTKITGNVTNGIPSGCVFGAYKNVEITGESSQPTLNPTPTKGTLIVIKGIDCSVVPGCPGPVPSNLELEGTNPPRKVVTTFHPCDDTGCRPTEVTLNPCDFGVNELSVSRLIKISFSGDCIQDDENPSATGNKTGDLALVITEWSFTGTGSDGKNVNLAANSADVLRQQPDGTWLFVIDNPWGTE